VVLLMNDPQAAQRVVDTVKRVAPGVPVLMRTRYLGERAGLLRLGARDVVAEEVEGAVEIISRMLRGIDIPRNVIDDRIRGVRSDTQTSERKQTVPRKRLGEVGALSELKIECALVHEQSPAAGASPVTLRLRSETGALVVGVRRDDKLLEKLDPTASFQPGDIVYFVGTNDAVTRAVALFEPEPKQGEGDAA
jgi:CPA2 family monovalent cation:H+ antiporter-2